DLVARFAASTHALPGADAIVRSMLDRACSHLDVSMLSMTDADLVELLFRVYPARVMESPENANDIVASARAFFRFLLDEGHPRARKLLAALTPYASRFLADLLADEERFDAVKTLLVQGHREGYDCRERGRHARLDRRSPPARSGPREARAGKARFARTRASAKEAQGRTRGAPSPSVSQSASQPAIRSSSRLWCSSFCFTKIPTTTGPSGAPRGSRTP